MFCLTLGQEQWKCAERPTTLIKTTILFIETHLSPLRKLSSIWPLFYPSSYNIWHLLILRMRHCPPLTSIWHRTLRPITVTVSFQCICHLYRSLHWLSRINRQHWHSGFVVVFLFYFSPPMFLCVACLCVYMPYMCLPKYCPYLESEYIVRDWG